MDSHKFWSLALHDNDSLWYKKFSKKQNFKWRIRNRNQIFSRDNWQRWSRGHKARGQCQGQGHKKNPRPRPRTAFPRTDTLEAKDRNARGQGQGSRTQTQVLSKKKIKGLFTKIFQAISKIKKKKKGLHKNFSSDLHENTFIFQSLHKILTIQKLVLSSSRGQANFRGLEASRPRPRPRTWPSRLRPRPRTSKCVLEDVLDDSTSDNWHTRN